MQNMQTKQNQTRVSFTRISGNAKTGPIPVSMTESSSCPDSCPLLNAGCYARFGMVGMHWRKLDKGITGMDWQAFTQQVKELPRGTLWRHNAAGDLPQIKGHIKAGEFTQLVNANKGKQGFTYTHHTPELDDNASLIKHANEEGFTVNLSANSAEHADSLASLNIGPVVTLLPEEAPKLSYTPAGRAIVKCPATYIDSMTCAACALCANSSRKSIVGFPVHGTGKRKAEQTIKLYRKGE